MQNESDMPELDRLPDLTKTDLILYDLGGVHYFVHYQKSMDEFAKLALLSHGEVPVFSQLVQDELFNLFEEGKITAAEFRIRLRDLYKIHATDTEIDHAWNALLGGLIPGRTEYLAQVKQHHRLALLSNTNEIHLNAIYDECKPLFDQFETCFFSNLIKMRKPNTEIFEFVLQELNLNANQVLFIDDSPQHIQTASRMGFHTWHLTNPADLLQVVPAIV